MTPAALVVDDEPDLAATCERLQRRAGYTVVTVTSRRSALAALDAAPFALAVVDRHLPDGDGLDVLRVAREHAIPVVIMTGYASATSRTSSHSAGAAAYLAKPFSAQAFLAAVGTAVAASPPDRAPGPADN